MQWVFGGSFGSLWDLPGTGMDFSSGKGELMDIQTPFSSFESCASICDGDGKLLFFTDGYVVYNRNHDTMPNGRDLAGWWSTSQGAIIVPKPEDEFIYYIFTQEHEARDPGLTYSVIDMRLDNGMGDVVPGQKNIPLLSPVTEKMTAVHHSNCRDIWVIVHQWMSDEFYAYLVTPDGVDPNPVVTAGGTVLGSQGISQIFGTMKTSHRGEWLALTRGDDTIELYRFDVETGRVSDYMPLVSPSVWLNFRQAYGVEFSPDDSKLYVSTYQGGQIFQFDLLKETADSISASAVEMGNCYCFEQGDLQLGPDGIIYATTARSINHAIGTIENPDEKYPGAVYTRDAFITFDWQATSMSLPNFVQSLVMDFGCDFEPPPPPPPADPKGWFVIPTAFSPNNDGHNNTFGPVFNDYEVTDYTLTIYNRWGEKLFETNDPEIPWDGTYRGVNVQMDAYLWLIRFRHDHKVVTKSGTVTLIR